MKIKKPKSFTIKRKRWYRGKGPALSRLRAKSGGMQCCLGFYARACGVPSGELTGIISPAGLVCRDATLPRLLTRKSMDNKICNKMMSVNDNCEMPAKKRESMLRRLFKRIGVKVKFQ